MLTIVKIPLLVESDYLCRILWEGLATTVAGGIRVNCRPLGQRVGGSRIGPEVGLSTALPIVRLLAVWPQPSFRTSKADNQVIKTTVSIGIGLLTILTILTIQLPQPFWGPRELFC